MAREFKPDDFIFDKKSNDESVDAWEQMKASPDLIKFLTEIGRGDLMARIQEDLELYKGEE